MKKLIAMLLFAAAGQVSADDYVCSVNFIPPHVNGSSIGKYGGVGIQIYNGPHCTNGYKESFVFCSTGANGAQPNCAKNVEYGEASLMALFRQFNDQAAAGRKMWPQPAQCVDPKFHCWGQVVFPAVN